jgi:Putative peptidoglycan binding domain
VNDLRSLCHFAAFDRNPLPKFNGAAAETVRPNARFPKERDPNVFARGEAVVTRRRNKRTTTKHEKEKHMKKLAIALLASSALAVPAFAAPMNNPAPKQQSRMQQPQAGTNAQQPGQQAQNAAQNQPQSQASAPSSQRTAFAPGKLSHNQVRKIQVALNKHGFDAGPVDGTWGPRTRDAVRHFQKAKDISARGRLTKKTLSDLGVTVASNQYSGNRTMSGMSGQSQQPRQPNRTPAAGYNGQGDAGR